MSNTDFIEFNSARMIGRTSHDNNELKYHIRKGYELSVDNNGHVYTNSGVYIADVNFVENGQGIYNLL